METNIETTNQLTEKTTTEVTDISPNQSKAKRRIGTFTMGISMIVVGIAIIIRLISPAIDLTIFTFFAPAILILLGIELIVSYFIFPKENIKFDFLSCVICFFMCIFTLGFSVVPLVVSYFSPENIKLEQRLDKEFDDIIYDSIGSVEGISGFSSSVYTNHAYMLNPEDFELSNIKEIGSSSVNISLFNDFKNTDEFAAKCEEILGKLKDTHQIIGRIDFHTADNAYWLYLSDRVAYSLDAERLSSLTETTDTDDWDNANEFDIDDSNSYEYSIPETDELEEATEFIETPNAE